MYIELESGTDVATHVLYDPANVTHIKPGEDWDSITPLYDEDPDKGNVLLCSTASDGGAFYRIYIDEDIPAEFASHKHYKIGDLLLKVPSGKLVASGAEYINDPVEVPKAKPFDPSKSELVTSAEIPPGNYLVDTYEMDWDWNNEIVPALKKEFGYKYGLADTLGCGGCLIIFAGIFAVIMGIKRTPFIWGGLIDAWVYRGILMCIFIGPGLWALLPKGSQLKQLAFQMKHFPEYILVFKKLPDDEEVSDYHGGCFGLAEREKQSQKDIND